MRGFLGFYHYGHPCFLREEYESAHEGEDELARIEDALGMTFSSFDCASYYALTHARYLLYRCEDDSIDQELLAGRDPWMPYRNGYVHIVTGEFVYGAKPTWDSYPCWKKEEPLGSYFGPNAVQTSGAIGIGLLALGFLAALLNRRR